MIVTTRKTYQAFISYRRASDEVIAGALQAGLHKLAKPLLKWRAMRVFRDITSIPAGPDLKQVIRQRLEDSEFFILLACPEAFESIGSEGETSWVEQELLYWCTNCGGQNKVLVVKTGGGIHWGHASSGIDWAMTTSIPSRLKEYLSPNPVVIDLSWARLLENRTRLSLRDPEFANAVAALAEPIYGRDREELFSEDGRQRTTAVILRNVAIAALVVLAIIASAFGVLATKNQILAERRSQLNISERLAAESELTLKQFPQRSALLAAEAIRVARAANVSVPSAEDAARRALEVFYGSRPLRHPGLATIAVSPDGRWLATGGSDHLIKIWDLTDIEAPPKVLEGHTTTPSRMVFSNDGRWMISAGEYWGRAVISESDDHNAILWSIATLNQNPSKPAQQITPQFLAGTSVPIQLAFSPEGDVVTGLFADGRVLVCDLRADHPCDATDPRSWLNPVQEAKTLAFDPTGHWLAIGYRDGTARLWSRATLMSSRNFVVLSGHDDPVVYALSFSPDGNWLVTLSADQQSDSGAPPTTSRSARLWSMALIEPSARPVAKIVPIRSTHQRVWDVKFSPDSQWLLMRAETPDLRLWRVQEGGIVDQGFNLQGEAANQFDYLASAAFSPHGALVATGSSSGVVRVWRIQSGTPVPYRSLANSNSEVTSMLFSSAEKEIFIGGRDGVIRVWDLTEPNGLPIAELRGHEGEVSRALLARGDASLITASFADQTVGGRGDESVRQYHLSQDARPESASSVVRIPGNGYNLRESRNRKWIALQTEYDAVTLAQVNNKGVSTPIIKVSGKLAGAAFSDDSKWLLTLRDHSVGLWDLDGRAGRELPLLSTRESPAAERAVAAQISPDGSSLVIFGERSLRAFALGGREDPMEIFSSAAPNGCDFTGDGSHIESREREWTSEASLSTDGRWLLTVCHEEGNFGSTTPYRGTALLWDLRNASSHSPASYALEATSAHSGCLASSRVLVSRPDGSILTWNLPYNGQQHPFVAAGIGEPHSITQNMFCSEDGRWAITLSQTAAILWDLTNPREIRRSLTVGPETANAIHGDYGAWSGAQFSSDGRWALIRQKQEAEPLELLWLLRLDPNGSTARRLPASSGDSFVVAALSDDGKWLATGGAEDTARNVDQTSINLWQLAVPTWGSAPIRLSQHDVAVAEFSFSGSGRYLISIGRDRSVIKWDVYDEKPGTAFSRLVPGSEVRFLSDAHALTSESPNEVLIVSNQGTLSEEYTVVNRLLLMPSDLEMPLRVAAGRVLTPEERALLGPR